MFSNQKQVLSYNIIKLISKLNAFLIMKKIRLIGLAALVLGLAGCDSATDEQSIKDMYDTTPAVVRQIDTKKKSIAFVIDTSGSMNDKLNGERKIDSVKKSLDEILKIYNQYSEENNNVEAGVFYFSSYGVKNLVPIEKFDYNKITEKTRGLSADSGTPIGIALAYAERELDKKATGSKNIVLLTDGMSNSGVNPDDVWERILYTNKTIGDSPTNLYIVAFNTSKAYFKELAELGAVIYEAKDASELSQVLKDNTGKILEKY